MKKLLITALKKKKKKNNKKQKHDYVCVLTEKHKFLYRLDV